jgi:hypothetical protein
MKSNTDKNQPTDKLPYLAIKNWDKYQSNRAGKPLPWLRDYADQTIDPAYSRLSLFERGLLQECRRLRTRTQHNLHNDITWIARASNTITTDRARLQHALDTLIQRGFLTPTKSRRDPTTDTDTETEQNQKQKQSQRRDSRTEGGSDSRMPDQTTEGSGSKSQGSENLSDKPLPEEPVTGLRKVDVKTWGDRPLADDEEVQEIVI